MLLKVIVSCPGMDCLLPLANVFAYAFCRRAKIETTQLVCPSCRSSKARRSRRRTMSDYLLALTGILPWRCESCETRFHARPFPLRNFIYAHCGICGNLELERIAPHHVPGPAAIFGRILGLPALRCAPCRSKFFSIRPLRREARGGAAAQSQ